MNCTADYIRKFNLVPFLYFNLITKILLNSHLLYLYVEVVVQSMVLTNEDILFVLFHTYSHFFSLFYFIKLDQHIALGGKINTLCNSKGNVSKVLPVS